MSAFLSLTLILEVAPFEARADNKYNQPPPELKGFAVELWKFFLSDTPQWSGAETFTEDQEASKKGPFPYGFFVYGLRDFLENKEVRELQKKGREYRTQYWLDMVNAFLANELHGHQFNLNPFQQITDAMDEITRPKKDGMRPMNRLEIEAAARSQIQDRILNRTSLSMEDLNRDPMLRRTIPRIEMPFEVVGERPGGKNVDFERWRDQQLEFIDQVLLQNFKTSLDIMTRDYGLTIGLHPKDEVFDRYERSQRRLPETISKHLETLSSENRDEFRNTLNRWQFKLERMTLSESGRERTRVLVSRDGGKNFDFILSVWSPVKGQYFWAYYYLQNEYEELRPTLPRGLFNLLHHMMPIRHYKYDMNAVALGMQNALAEALMTFRKELSLSTEGQLSELRGLISELSQKYRHDQIANIEVHARVQTGGLGSMDKWFDPSDLQDLIWYGFSQSDGFRHWYERDLQAARSGSLPLINEDPHRFIPSKAAFKSMSFFKWLWFLIKKMAGSAWNTIQKGSTRKSPSVDMSEGIAIEGWSEILAALARSRGSASDEVRAALLRELFRLDQPFKGAAIPQTFDMAYDVDFLGHQPVRVLTLEESRSRPDLVIDAKAWLVPSNGILGLPRSRDQELLRARLFSSSGRTLIHGTDYEVVENARNGALGLRLLKEDLGPLFKYVLDYRSLQARQESEQMHRPVNMERLKIAIASLASRGHQVLAQNLASYWARAKSSNTSISLRDLEVLLKGSTLYSLSNRGVDVAGNSCLNCKGSSSLAVQFFNTLFAKSDGVVIEERTCFRRGRQSVLTGGGAHSHVLFTFTKDGSYAYVDTVATEVDPREKLPGDIEKAWTSDDQSAPEHKLPRHLQPAEKGKNRGFSRAGLGVASVVGLAAAGAYVYADGGTSHVDIMKLIQMAKEMPPKVYLAAAAIAGTSYAIQKIWKKWKKYQANRFVVSGSQSSERQLIQEGMDDDELKGLVVEDPKVNQLKFEAPEIATFSPHVQIAVGLMQSRFKDLEKHVNPSLVRRLSDQDPVIAAARLTHLAESVLTGALTPERVRQQLKREFGAFAENEGGTQALLRSLSSVAERFRVNLVYLGEQVRAGQRVAGVQHLVDPVFRRDVERVFESIIEALGKVDVGDLPSSGRIDCQSKLEKAI